MIKIFILLLCVRFILCDTKRCPGKCRCTFSNLVDCSQLNLINVSNQFSNETVKLILSYNNISNLQSSTFSDLEQLEFLDLSYNNLTFVQRNFFSYLHLETLKLDHNNLQFSSTQKEKNRGLFKDDIVETLRNFSASYNKLSGRLYSYLFHQLEQLVHLDLSYNHFTSVENDSFPTGLEYLDLRYNFISKIEPFAFSFMDDLTYLNLRGLKLRTLNSRILQDLQFLQNFSFGGKLISALPRRFLRNLSFVKHLEIVETNITTLPEKLLEYTNVLISLNLSDNKLTTIPGSFLRFSSSLRSLNLKKNNLITIPDSIDSFSPPILNDLNLDLNHLTKVPQVISKMSFLQNLTLSHNNLSLKNLTFSSPSLKFINLTNCSISFLNSNIFLNATSLQVVDLSSNKLSTFPHLNTEQNLNVFINDNTWNCNCLFYRTFSEIQAGNVINNTAYKCSDNTLDCVKCHMPEKIRREFIGNLDEVFVSCSDPEFSPAPQHNITSIILIIVVLILLIVLMVIAIVLIKKYKKNNKKNQRNQQPVKATNHWDDSNVKAYAVIYESVDDCAASKTKDLKLSPLSLSSDTPSPVFTRATNPGYSSISVGVLNAKGNKNLVHSYANHLPSLNQNASSKSLSQLPTDKEGYLFPVQNNTSNILPSFYEEHKYENQMSESPDESNNSKDLENSPYLFIK